MMLPLPSHSLRQFSDVLRLPDGQSLLVRFVEPDDIGSLLDYLRSLSRRSRYNRFLGARLDLPDDEIARMVHTGEANCFAVIGELRIDGAERIVCEARYALDGDGACEFGLSVGDDWQGQGIGTALLSNLECRAAALGATQLFGDTLRSNDELQGLARKRDFAFTHSPEGWTFVRMQKSIDRATQEIPCVQWREIASSVAPAI